MKEITEEQVTVIYRKPKHLAFCDSPLKLLQFEETCLTFSSKEISIKCLKHGEWEICLGF